MEKSLLHLGKKTQQNVATEVFLETLLRHVFF